MDIGKTIKSLKDKGYEVSHVQTASDVLNEIKKIIPDKASVMNGSSVTLEQIGYLDYLKSGEHKWIDLHAQIASEDDQEKRQKLRRESSISDFYLGSVHALMEDGEFIVASNTASQIPSITYTSQNLVFVVSTKKVVGSLDEGMKRLVGHVVPLENKRVADLYGSDTELNKILIFKGESSYSSRKIHFILVDEDLGF